MRAIILVGCATAAWLAGCATIGNDVETETTFVVDQRFVPSEQDPELFLGSKLPGRPYQQLALMEISGRDGSTTEELLATLRSEARQIGADAIVDIRLAHKQRVREFLTLFAPVDTDPDRDKTEYDATTITAVAVRYTDGQPGLPSSTPDEASISPPAATPPTAASPSRR